MGRRLINERKAENGRNAVDRGRGGCRMNGWEIE